MLIFDLIDKKFSDESVMEYIVVPSTKTVAPFTGFFEVASITVPVTKDCAIVFD
jgi:hypothetical protein